jgi:hypothetical protein
MFDLGRMIPTGGDMIIGEPIIGGTLGSILFAGVNGILAQDNSNLFYDSTNKRLLIGTATGIAIATGGNFQVVTPAIAGTAEVLSTWRVSDDATGMVQIFNAINTDNNFVGGLRGIAAGVNIPIWVEGQITTDSATNPAFVYNARTVAAATIVTRPLFDWRNNNVSMLQLIPLNSGANACLTWGTQLVASPTFTTRTLGTRVVLYNSIGASSTDFAIGIEANGIWFGVHAVGSSEQFRWYAGTTEILKINGLGDSVQTQGVHTTGSPTMALWTGAANTTLTASVEATDINFNLARTVQFAQGALTTQRAFVIQAPTYGFATGASTLTTAATLAITNAPQPGTNATITKSYALWVQAGDVQLAGSGSALATNATTGFPHLPTCVGTPSGVPAALMTGAAPIIVDSSANKIWVYVSGSWKGILIV